MEDRAAFFKGSFYANDQYKEEELQFEFTLNNKFDGFNISRSVDFQEIIDSNGEKSLLPGQAKFSNI